MLIFHVALQLRQGLFRCGRREHTIKVNQILFRQLDVDRPRVIADVLFAACFWNSDYAGLTQHPPQRDLRGSGVATFGNFLERRILKQTSAVADRRVSHDRNRRRCLTFEV